MVNENLNNIQIEGKGTIPIQFNQIDKEKIENIAQENGLKTASFCRFLILKSINNNGGIGKN